METIGNVGEARIFGRELGNVRQKHFGGTIKRSFVGIYNISRQSGFNFNVFDLVISRDF